MQGGRPEAAAAAREASSSGAIPHVKLSAELTNPMDILYSGQLLASTLVDGIYTCPRCSYTSTDKTTFMEHLTEEMNKSLTEMAQLTQRRPPAKETKAK